MTIDGWVQTRDWHGDNLAFIEDGFRLTSKGKLVSLRDTRTRREQALSADDLGESVVDVPEWGIDVLLRGMTGKERMRYVESSKGRDREYMYSDILIATAYDPDSGEKMFDDADREALSEKSGLVLERLALKIMADSGVDLDEAEDEVAADPTSVGA